jgi:hypothetical protein
LTKPEHKKKSPVPGMGLVKSNTEIAEMYLKYTATSRDSKKINKIKKNTPF